MTLKEKVKQLWKICFNDSDEFVELYFRLRYNNKVNLAIQSGDDVISALQMIPYPMTIWGTEVNTSYISGACTHPEYQGKGVMRELLSQAFAQMTKRDVHISTLIPAKPWLFDYYAKAGYAPVFHHTKTTVIRTEIPAPEDTELKQIYEYDEDIYTYFNAQMHQRPCCIQHDVDDYKVVLEDLHLSEGAVFAAYQQDKVVGVIFAEPQDDGIKVKEVVANNTPVKECLVQKAIAHFHTTKAIVISPPDAANKQTTPIGMARIIYAKPILQLYAAANPHVELNIELTDHQLSLNNGYYYLVNGKCMTSEKRLPGNHQLLTIGELTQMLLAPEQPYMSLMLD
ncbi:GNAT family N-acetyltransferase [Bacteroides sp. OttesenSCG-928-E20]|nr:GNAT family N-acetyltransferase [Bacteroides sp. OttesenSCG-928-N06]MDL2299730.1 GNAT family N-acetyltransferase [Bacteroides sp. OttesenSCG-928-E20]